MNIEYRMNAGTSSAADFLQTEFLINLKSNVCSGKSKALHHSSIHVLIAEIIKELPEETCNKIYGMHIHETALFFDDFIININENQNYYARQDKETTNKTEFYISLVGNPEKVQKYEKVIDNRFSLQKFPRIEWWYDTKEDGVQSKTIPLHSSPKARSEFYPWFNGDINEHLKKFIKHNASILMLFGPPGTGKTSLLRDFIYHNELTAMVSYEDVMLENDELFLSFLNRKEETVLLVEDADLLISSRSEGNKLISRFLNMADGIVSHAGKKIIFTSNINNYANIDDALLRPGRCFDVIEFKLLSQNEADTISTMLDKPFLTNKKEYTLAEIFNQGEATDKPVSKFGF